MDNGSRFPCRPCPLSAGGPGGATVAARAVQAGREGAARTRPLTERRVGAGRRPGDDGTPGPARKAPREGMGVTDPELRARHETAINRFRNV